MDCRATIHDSKPVTSQSVGRLFSLEIPDHRTVSTHEFRHAAQWNERQRAAHDRLMTVHVHVPADQSDIPRITELRTVHVSV